jgi:hypothetical protein
MSFPNHAWSKIVAEKVEAVQIEPGSDRLESVTQDTFEIKLKTSTVGAEIHYRIERFKIDSIIDAIYTDPIPIHLDNGEIILIMAIATKPGFIQSDTTSRFYTYAKTSNVLLSTNSLTRRSLNLNTYSILGKVISRSSATSIFYEKR